MKQDKGKIITRVGTIIQNRKARVIMQQSGQPVMLQGQGMMQQQTPQAQSVMQVRFLKFSISPNMLISNSIIFDF